MHPTLPFVIGQIGKAFRNDIAPRGFLFRQREFEQMELQYYIRPDEEEGKKQFEYWKQFAFDWYVSLGFKKEHLRLRQHADDERAHYAKDAWDIECSGGVDRAVLFVLLEAYREDELGGEVRTYLALAPKIAPVKAAVFPLLKNKPELVAKAREIYSSLKTLVSSIQFDDNGNIGKRYRRQDEIGTPFCVTIDFDTLGEHPELKDTVTLRHRDTGEQERLSIPEAAARICSAIE